MLEADLALYRARGKGNLAEQAAVEHLYRVSQIWLLEHYGDSFDEESDTQIARLVYLGLPRALNMSVEQYIDSVPRASAEPFTEIAHDTGETNFRSLIVEARLSIEKLLELDGFEFPKGLTEKFTKHDAFFVPDNPYIVWPVNPQTKDNPPQQMVLRKEDGKFRRRGIGIYEAVNLVLQSQAEGVLAKIPYHREDFFNRITEDDRYYDDLTLGIQNGKPFIKCPDIATC